MYAEIFPPGDFIREELDERDWTQKDLSKILGKSSRLVNEIVNARRAITPETAKALAGAFGTSAEYWMNLESAWQLHQLNGNDDDIRRRAVLYGNYPVKAVVQRGWVEDSESIDVLEAHFREFFVPAKKLTVPVSYRKTVSAKATPLQEAWFCRAYQLAQCLPNHVFSQRKLATCFAEIRTLMGDAENVRHVPRLLDEAGIRFVIVEALPGSKVDGVCFWIGKSPTIALSLRFDRIDYFWFTLLHELSHVANGDGKTHVMVDVDIENDEGRNEVERRANIEAAEFIVAKQVLDDFIDRVGPLYSFQRVLGFARINRLHPGLVVGQLHHRGEVPFSNFRKLLVSIRAELLDGAVTDGWGHWPSGISA